MLILAADGARWFGENLGLLLPFSPLRASLARLLFYTPHAWTRPHFHARGGGLLCLRFDIYAFLGPPFNNLARRSGGRTVAMPRVCTHLSLFMLV